MDAATQEINAATQSMALYSLLPTVFVGIGTGLLIWTLFLTRSANHAAVAAVAETRRIGETQLRAWVGVERWQIEINGDINTGMMQEVLILIDWKNSGSTPAYEVSIKTGLASDKIFSEDSTWNEDGEAVINIMPNSPGAFGRPVVFSPERIVASRDDPIVIKSAVRYRTIFDQTEWRYSDTTWEFRYRGQATLEQVKAGNFSYHNMMATFVRPSGKMT